MQHSVTAADGSFDSGLVAAGVTWKRTFTAPAFVDYHCTPHPWMKAVVRVAALTGGRPPGAPAGSRIAAAAKIAAPPPEPVRQGSGPVTHTVNIVEPSLTDAMSWGFNPSIVDARAGDTIVWHNTGTLQHSVTADTFDAGLIDPGKTFSRLFDQPGVYAFHCTPHPWMKGVVRVTSAEGGAPPPLPELTGTAGPGEQAAGPLGTNTLSGDIGLPRILREPFDNSNRPFFFSLLAVTAVLALIWFFAATPWRPRPEGSKVWLTGKRDAGTVRP